MLFEKRMSHRGDPREVLATVRDALLAQEFILEREYEYTFTVRGPGMWRKRPLPLQGISRVQVSVTGDAVSATAELDALRSFQTFIIGAPLVIDVIAAIACGVVIAPWVGALVACATVLPYLIIGPLIARIYKKRTEAALDAVLANATGQIKR